MIEVLGGIWNGTDVRLGISQRGGYVSFYSNELAYVQLENWYEDMNVRLQVEGVTVSVLSLGVWNGTIPADTECVIHWSWAFLMPHEENFLFWVGLLGIILVLFGLMLTVYCFRHYPIFTLTDRELVWEKEALIAGICAVIIGAGLIITWLLS